MSKLIYRLCFALVLTVSTSALFSGPVYGGLFSCLCGGGEETVPPKKGSYIYHAPPGRDGLTDEEAADRLEWSPTQGRGVIDCEQARDALKTKLELSWDPSLKREDMKKLKVTKVEIGSVFYRAGEESPLRVWVDVDVKGFPNHPLGQVRGFADVVKVKCPVETLKRAQRDQCNDFGNVTLTGDLLTEVKTAIDQEVRNAFKEIILEKTGKKKLQQNTEVPNFGIVHPRDRDPASCAPAEGGSASPDAPPVDPNIEFV